MFRVPVEKHGINSHLRQKGKIAELALCYAMRMLSHCFICGHIHDELIIEADPRVSLDAVVEQMSRTPPWAKGLILRADSYETPFKGNPEMLFCVISYVRLPPFCQTPCI